MQWSYRPFYKLMFGGNRPVSSVYIERLNAAAMDVALKNYGYWNVEFMFDVEKAYENLSS